MKIQTRRFENASDIQLPGSLHVFRHRFDGREGNTRRARLQSGALIRASSTVNTSAVARALRYGCLRFAK
ncbi:hypothetical protein [Burkholderia lata]|uniref:hypothetical protein n=1 Tax=Burkholderia lata (strain ATCC 17760 / DSM 23089 / LMG 22485 / NCIMB 9086 / R18194 / 383) TaxID=482957 RepID=UPI00242D4E7E|nr:hypothetical protein [Burkholderia lata]